MWRWPTLRASLKMRWEVDEFDGGGLRKTTMRMLVAIALLGGALAFGQSAEPTKEEIAEAYRSKSGGVVMLVPPGGQWEQRRINEIRGWKLKFTRISQKRFPGIRILKYHAVAKKNAMCADYQITDTMPFGPPGPQIKPILAVDLNGVRACR